VDLYRLTATEELWELGWEELGSAGEMALVEWPEKAGEYLPGDRWEVELAVVDGDTAKRVVEVNRFGSPRALPGFPVSLEEGG
jgi:tRNA A37 threonylcarbamoyladenosine biosynthesis protein TsaE